MVQHNEDGVSVPRMKRCGREKMSRRSVSSSTTREMEDDATADLDRYAHRYSVRYD